MSSKKLSPEVAAAIRELGRQGGKQRAANLSDKQRTAIAKKAAAARWKKKPEK